MSLSEKVYKLLNAQVTNELGASHAYLAMSMSFESMGLLKLATRFMHQSDEERGHALKFAKYIHDVGRQVQLAALPEPRRGFKTVREILEASLKSEQTVTAEINAIADAAAGANDHATLSFLKWFIDEQVEEVATVQEMLQLLELAGDMPLLLIEERMAEVTGEAAP